ncbi:MAG: hypothetical protein IJ574_04775 [Bacilli bacterium]|nr:hypothetical protein [Bacilli bacterium]
MKLSKYIYGTILLLITILIVSGGIVVKNRHENKMYVVVEKEILEAANKCKLDDVCNDSEVDLEYLYENNYLNEQINPVTKRKYDSNLTINFANPKVDWINS